MEAPAASDLCLSERLTIPGDEELRAAAADLRHLQGFLASVARGLEESELAPSDAELAALAARQSHAVADLAAVLEQALG